MINRTELQEYVYEHCQIGTYNDSFENNETFFIIPGWHTIREINSQFQNWNYDDTRVCGRCNCAIDNHPNDTCKESHSPYYDLPELLNLDQILGYAMMDDDKFIPPFPLYESDILQLVELVSRFDEYNSMIAHGQLAFLDNSPMWTFDGATYDTAKSILIPLFENNYDAEYEFYNVDAINETLKDEYIDRVEWGFDDEYELCSECGNTIYRITADCYNWQPDYYQNDDMRCCKACAPHPDDIIEDIQNALDNGVMRTLPEWCNLPDDFQRVKHPYDSENHNATFESGFHPGQKDSPAKQAKYLRQMGLKVLFTIYPSQFDVEWDIYVKPEDDSIILADEFLSQLGDALLGECKTKYDLATLYSQALKQPTNGRFNSISVDTETGKIDIRSTDDLEEFTRSH